MATLEYLQVDNSNLKKTQFNVQSNIKGETYQFSFFYNTQDKRVYVNIKDIEGNIIKSGRPVLFANNILDGISENAQIIPFDFSGIETEVTVDNIGNSVKLFIAGVV